MGDNDLVALLCFVIFETLTIWVVYSFALIERATHIAWKIKPSNETITHFCSVMKGSIFLFGDLEANERWFKSARHKRSYSHLSNLKAIAYIAFIVIFFGVLDVGFLIEALDNADLAELVGSIIGIIEVFGGLALIVYYTNLLKRSLS